MAKKSFYEAETEMLKLSAIELMVSCLQALRRLLIMFRNMAILVGMAKFGSKI